MKDYLLIRKNNILYGFVKKDKYIVTEIEPEYIDDFNLILSTYLRTFMVERWLICDYDIYIPILRANTKSLISHQVNKLIDKLPNYFIGITQKDLTPIKQNTKI
jgi:hypothetical protein